jgi:hypothetical protein
LSSWNLNSISHYNNSHCSHITRLHPFPRSYSTPKLIFEVQIGSGKRSGLTIISTESTDPSEKIRVNLNVIRRLRNVLSRLAHKISRSSENSRLT